jgi:hypothetical protein
MDSDTAYANTHEEQGFNLCSHISEGRRLLGTRSRVKQKGSALVSNMQTNKAEAKGRLLKANITVGQIIPLNQFDKALTLFVTNLVLKKEKR